MQLNELASPATPPPTSTFNHVVPSGTLVYHLDMFILAIILAFSLFNIPRMCVYIANNRSEAFQGYLLRSTTQFGTHRSLGRKAQSTEKDEEPPEFTLPTLASRVAPKQPWYFPILFSLRHTAVSCMQYRVFENYTVGQVLLKAGWAAAILYAAFYRANPFSVPERCAFVVVSQIPFVFALATKNNIIGLLVGVGYDKLNYLHRHVGRLMVIGVNVHAIGYIYKWTLAGSVSQKIVQPYVVWGIVALICFDLLGIFSVQYVRMKSYNLFLGTHIVAFVVVLFAACYHRPACIPYVVAGAAVYGLDHMMRVVKTRFATATLQTIPELGLTRVDISSLKTGWRPGQHVRLRVLSTAMGFRGMTEVHPFTIASATDTEEGLVLMCRKTGRWTQKLYEMAQTPAIGEQCRTLKKRVQVMVEGPYGGVGDISIPSYSGVLFVVGGSGVTFALSAVQDLVLAGAKSRTRVIEVVWCVREPAALKSFIPVFAALASESDPAHLHVSVFCTRATSRSLKGLSFPPGITLTPGRPTIGALLSGFVRSVAGRDGMHGAFVGVCGPRSLGRDVANAMRTRDATLTASIGGIHLHEEVFAW